MPICEGPAFLGKELDLSLRAKSIGNRLLGLLPRWQEAGSHTAGLREGDCQGRGLQSQRREIRLPGGREGLAEAADFLLLPASVYPKDINGAGWPT